MRKWLLAAAAAVAAILLGAAPTGATVRDDLSIVAPAPITVQATTPCGSSWCAFVTYSFTVTGGTPPYTLICNLPSPRFFLVGVTTVSCFAQDAHVNSTPPATFQGTVAPPDSGGSSGGDGSTTAPLTIIAPGPMTAAATTQCGSSWCALVSYSYTATGGAPPYNFTCNLPSPHLFLVGITTVSCFAQDSAGDSTPEATFQVTVTAPAPSAGGAGTGSSGGAGESGSTAASGSGTSSGPDPTSGTAATPAPAAATTTPAPATTPTSAPEPAAATAPEAEPAESTQPAAVVETPAVEQATMATPRIEPAPRGGENLVFALRLPAAATIRGTLLTPTGHALLRFRAQEAGGRPVLSKRLPSSGLRKGTLLTLRLAITVDNRTRTITKRFRA